MLGCIGLHFILPLYNIARLSGAYRNRMPRIFCCFDNKIVSRASSKNQQIMDLDFSGPLTFWLPAKRSSPENNRIFNSDYFRGSSNLIPKQSFGQIRDQLS